MEFYAVYLDRLVDIIHRMGQALYEFGFITPPPSQNILSHIKGQLYLGRATLLIMRAVKDQGAWRDARKLGWASLIWELFQHRSVEGVRKVIAGPILQLLAGGHSQWGKGWWGWPAIWRGCTRLCSW